MLPEGIKTMAVAWRHRGNFRPCFVSWLSENLNVWHAFNREANKVWDRGRRHYSARTIIEYLRHETGLTDNGSEFKINGNNVSDLARLYALMYPDRAGFFEFRRRVVAA